MWKKKSIRLDLQRVNNKEKKWYKIRLWGRGLGTCTFSQNSAKKIVKLSALWWPFGVVDFWARRYFPPLFVQSHKPGLAGSKYSFPEWWVMPFANKKFYTLTCVLSFCCGLWMFYVLLGAFRRICFHSTCGPITLWAKLMSFNYTRGCGGR